MDPHEGKKKQQRRMTQPAPLGDCAANVFFSVLSNKILPFAKDTLHYLGYLKTVKPSEHIKKRLPHVGGNTRHRLIDTEISHEGHAGLKALAAFGNKST